jgi:hypothetical protein
MVELSRSSAGRKAVPIRQTQKVSDMLLRAKTASANDNYLPTNSNTKNSELRSFVTQRDYVSPSKREELGLMAALCAGILALLVLKLADAI